MDLQLTRYARRDDLHTLKPGGDQPPLAGAGFFLTRHVALVALQRGAQRRRLGDATVDKDVTIHVAFLVACPLLGIRLERKSLALRRVLR